MGVCSFVCILSVEDGLSLSKVGERNIVGVGTQLWGQTFVSDQTWGPVLSPCQVDPVLKKLQDRYRGPEPSDMVEMFEGEQFFAAFERGISIDMGMVALGSLLLLPLLLPSSQACFSGGCTPPWCTPLFPEHCSPTAYSPWTLNLSHSLVTQPLCLLFPIKMLFAGFHFLSCCCSLQRAISTRAYSVTDLLLQPVMPLSWHLRQCTGMPRVI